MRKYFKELEFEYDMKTYYCDGYADIWHENVIGTQYDGECEVLIETGITHIEIEKIDVVIDGVASDVTNDSEVVEVAKEVVTDKIETL